MLIPLAIFIWLLVTNDRQPPPRPKINLDYATYKGDTLPNGVNQYLGMRYAAPPLDDLRWRAPRDPPVENKTQDAGEVWTPLLFCYKGLPLTRLLVWLRLLRREALQLEWRGRGLPLCQRVGSRGCQRDLEAAGVAIYPRRR